MRSKARRMLDKSISSMLASVEIYNKPGFGYREEPFSTLAMNAWELLLKVCILQLEGSKISAILVYENNTFHAGSKS